MKPGRGIDPKSLVAKLRPFDAKVITASLTDTQRSHVTTWGVVFLAWDVIRLLDTLQSHIEALENRVKELEPYERSVYLSKNHED